MSKALWATGIAAAAGIASLAFAPEPKPRSLSNICNDSEGSHGWARSFASRDGKDYSETYLDGCKFRVHFTNAAGYPRTVIVEFDGVTKDGYSASVAIDPERTGKDIADSKAIDAQRLTKAYINGRS